MVCFDVTVIVLFDHSCHYRPWFLPHRKNKSEHPNLKQFLAADEVVSLMLTAEKLDTLIKETVIVMHQCSENKSYLLP